MRSPLLMLRGISIVGIFLYRFLVRSEHLILIFHILSSQLGTFPANPMFELGGRRHTYMKLDRFLSIRAALNMCEGSRGSQRYIYVSEQSLSFCVCQFLEYVGVARYKLHNGFVQYLCQHRS